MESQSGLVERHTRRDRENPGLWILNSHIKKISIIKFWTVIPRITQTKSLGLPKIGLVNEYFTMPYSGFPSHTRSQTSHNRVGM